MKLIREIKPATPAITVIRSNLNYISENYSLLYDHSCSLVLRCDLMLWYKSRRPCWVWSFLRSSQMGLIHVLSKLKSPLKLWERLLFLMDFRPWTERGSTLLHLSEMEGVLFLQPGRSGGFSRSRQSPSENFEQCRDQDRMKSKRSRWLWWIPVLPHSVNPRFRPGLYKRTWRTGEGGWVSPPRAVGPYRLSVKHSDNPHDALKAEEGGEHRQWGVMLSGT